MSDEVLMSEMAGCVALLHFCILQASAVTVCVEPGRLGLGSYLNLVSARGCVEACYYSLLSSLAGYR